MKNGSGIWPGENGGVSRADQHWQRRARRWAEALKDETEAGKGAKAADSIRGTKMSYFGGRY